METQVEAFRAPVPQAQQGAQSDSPETCFAAPVGRFDPPAVVSLLSAEMKSAVEFFAVGFLKNSKAVNTVGNHGAVLFCAHGVNFHGNRREKRPEQIAYPGKVIQGCHFGSSPETSSKCLKPSR